MTNREFCFRDPDFVSPAYIEAVKTMNANRAVTLDGASRLFNGAGISIHKDPLGFYFSLGPVALRNLTLTGLCQQIIVELASQYHPQK